MKNKKKGFFLKSSMVFILGLLISSPFIISYYYLPGEVKLIAGREHVFNFDIPLYASILKSETLTIKGMDDDHFKKSSIPLNRPLYVSMEEEGETDIKLSLLGIPVKTVSVQAIKDRQVIPCGKIVGIKVDTQGLLVLGIGQFEKAGRMVSPAKGILEVGDMILTCNGTPLEIKEDLKDAIEASQNQPMKLKVMREGKMHEVQVQPIYCDSEGVYKLGVWIRDSTQGIGTLTYVDPETGVFGALGHGITDVDTKKLMPIREGTIISATVTNIKKGQKGTPGEISGTIHYDGGSIIGEVENNTAIGIYGVLSAEALHHLDAQKVPIAFQDEVHEGKASILVDLRDGIIKEYGVTIQKVSRYSNEPAKGMVIKITDEELLRLTNGIVQGMSGSPILQDGKLIGAVTHVFVQDPTRGYGIFIENMINNEKK
ncbi:SpoIVB peptidase [Sporanaerobium hydrogeniformans]|uniref:SpoIVB peptidase n=1 Tax=Sporanaerobium hydrogeniformans TaxID=3072179 RepID=A0AC61DHW3_9FIRM|nr:SpoIVB peptidase [Sporanaerobium hydrogeniformans]PHV72372.1 SpoIVB peptidase [Sporanaerobium hydrogeniformans]